MDDAIIGTNDDASSCKRYAVEKGYWQDPFLTNFVPRVSKKAPEINRGYYARTTSITILVEKYIKLTKGQCQIVNLGAGFDTLFWKLKKENLVPKCYVEVDFEQVTMRKCHFIKSKQDLLDGITDEDNDIVLNKTELHSGVYHLVSANLKSLPSLESKLSSCNMDRSLPTLFLTECVLVYIDLEYTDKIIKWIAVNFPTAFFLNYEQVKMGDSFGQVMIENLKARDCILSGVEACMSLETQLNRFLNNGWIGGDAMDMATVYKCLPQADLQRIERIEMLDERELLDQLLSHYCLVWAYKDTLDVGLHTLSIS